MKDTSYVSEETKFISQLLKDPNLSKERQDLRKTWWDRGFIDQGEQLIYHKSEIERDPYVYFSYHSRQNNENINNQ